MGIGWGRPEVRSCLLMLMTLGTLLLLVMALPAMALGQQQEVVTGRLVNGTVDGPVPAGVEVTLHAVRSTASVETRTAVTDELGTFRIEVPVLEDVASYVVSLSYEGAIYGRPIAFNELDQPVEITVYESTTDLAVLEVNSAALVLRPQAETEGMLTGSEVVSLVNTSDRTFIPDLTGPAMGQMNFMRFSLPPGATNLRLESDLAGGRCHRCRPWLCGHGIGAPGRPLGGVFIQCALRWGLTRIHPHSPHGHRRIPPSSPGRACTGAERYPRSWRGPRRVGV